MSHGPALRIALASEPLQAALEKRLRDEMPAESREHRSQPTRMRTTRGARAAMKAAALRPPRAAAADPSAAHWSGRLPA